MLFGSMAAQTMAVSRGYIPNPTTWISTGAWNTNVAYLSKNISASVSNGNVFTFSFWYRTDISASSVRNEVVAIGYSGCHVRILGSTNVIQVLGYQINGSTLVINGTTPATTLFDGNWHHICGTFNSTNASACKMAVDDTNVTISWPLSPTGAQLGFARNINSLVGTWNSGVAQTTCDYAEIWAGLQYFDISNATNRAKFISGGKPVDLGADGSTPTGVAPQLYFKSNAANITTNSGSLADTWTKVVQGAGAINDSTTTPVAL